TVLDQGAPGSSLSTKVSREDNWQSKFSQICQDIRDIQSNSYSSNKINNWKMTITPTQLGSTSILDNHKPPDHYNYGEGEKDDTYSPYKPVQDQTKDYNSDNQANCETPISCKSSAPPPISCTPPRFPAPSPIPRSPLWRPSSTSPSDERGDIAVQNELPSQNDISESGVVGPIGEDGGEESLKADSHQRETAEVEGEDGPPDPGPPGGTSGPGEELGTLPPAPSKTAVRMNLINESS